MSVECDRLIIRYFLIIRTEACVLGDEAHHLRLAKERREAALDEFDKRRYTVVGDMALKTVEQAIEAVASREGKHFHVSPRMAHALRVKWAKENFPEISADLDIVWSAYGDLGYDGLDGDRAGEAVEAMERIVDEIERRSGIRFR